MNTLEDFKGLKIRMPGLGGEVMRRLGATVVNLSGGEVTAALASSAIDWVEWSNPYGEASLEFYRHAKYYYTPGWHESGTVLELFINKKQWDGLEPDLKAIIEQCAFSANVVMLSEFQARSGPVLQQFINQYGVQVRRLTDEQLKRLGEVSGEVISEIIKTDPMSRKVFESRTNSAASRRPTAPSRSSTSSMSAVLTSSGPHKERCPRHASTGGTPIHRSL